MSIAESTTTTTWTIDSAHTGVEFSLKHLMISTVRGRFGAVSGTIVLDEANPEASVVVIHAGRLVYENYGSAVDAGTVQSSWSVSKSFASTVEGTNPTTTHATSSCRLIFTPASVRLPGAMHDFDVMAEVYGATGIADPFVRNVTPVEGIIGYPFFARYKMTINIEPHGYYTTKPEFMERMLAFSDSPYLRMNFDTGNTFIAGHNPLDYCKALRKYIVHCHIKDVSPALAGDGQTAKAARPASSVPESPSGQAPKIDW